MGNNDKISLPNQTEIMNESDKIISTGCKHIHRIFSENMLKKTNLYLVMETNNDPVMTCWKCTYRMN